MCNDKFESFSNFFYRSRHQIQKFVRIGYPMQYFTTTLLLDPDKLNLSGVQDKVEYPSLPSPFPHCQYISLPSYKLGLILTLKRSIHYYQSTIHQPSQLPLSFYFTQVHSRISIVQSLQQFNLNIFQDEKNQVLTTNVWFDHEWYDELLKWDPNEFGGIVSLQIPCDKIWLPDIVLYNRQIILRLILPLYRLY